MGYGVIHTTLLRQTSSYLRLPPDNGHVLAQTAIRTIDFSKPSERSDHDRLVALVDQMLRLHKRLREVPAGERTPVDERISEIDWQIDSRVYDLYGATDAEVALVEGQGSTGPRAEPPSSSSVFPFHLPMDEANNTADQDGHRKRQHDETRAVLRQLPRQEDDSHCN
jgi:hypothetical protein